MKKLTTLFVALTAAMVLSVQMVFGNVTTAATLEENLITASVNAVTGVSLNKTAITLTVGTSEQLIAIVTPDDALNKNLIWTSDNKAVSVDENGLVKADSIGTATITVTTEDGGYTAICEVTVKAIPYCSFVKVTSSSELVAGKKILIVNVDENRTMGKAATNNFPEAVISPDNSVLTEVPTEATIITLMQENNAYTFAVDGGYIAATTGDSNYLRKVAKQSTLTQWNITIDENGVANIVCADIRSERNTIRYNSSAKLFSAYLNENRNLRDVVIYIEGNPRPTDITYELNGGWTNDHGWQNKQDMYAGMNALWNAYANVPTDNTYYTWTSLDACAGDVTKGIPTACQGYTDIPAMTNTFFADTAVQADFQWLIDYMQHVCTLQEVKDDLLKKGNAAYLRYNLQAFFLNTRQTTWPITANYRTYGNIGVFQKYWKHGFTNPDTVYTLYTSRYVLQAPYREDTVDGIIVKYTFMGWYDNPAFEGDKIEAIDRHTADSITLYAKWKEYIATIAATKALTDGETTRMQGTITYFDGTEAYLQDNTGGVRVVFPEGTELAENTSYLVYGTKTTMGTPVFVVSRVIAQQVVEPVVPVIVNQVKKLSDYEDRLIKLEGKRIRAYSQDGDPSFGDDYDIIASYKLPIDQTQFPVRSKVDVVGVVERADEGLRIRAFAKNVTPVAPVGHDDYLYSVIPTGKGNLNYYLTNDWIYSNTLGNFYSNRPNFTTSSSRAMVMHNSALYFPNRDADQPTFVNFQKVNIKDGEMYDAIHAAEDLFHTYGRVGYDFVYGAANDMKKDNAGNILVANLVNNARQEYQVWVMDDIDNGKGHLLIDETNLNNGSAQNITVRPHTLGVYGDVNGDAIVMAASTSNVCYWTITNGMWNGSHEYIMLRKGYTFGSEPQIYPVSDEAFYVDGLRTYPVLFSIDGEVLDFFDTANEAYPALITNRNGETINTSNNGLCEFQLGDEDFLLMAGGNEKNTPASTFVLYKYADSQHSLADMVKMWEFPYDGMGNAANTTRTTAVSVQAVDNKTAKIAVYTVNNGYGVYTMSIGTSIPTDSQGTVCGKDSQDVRKVFRNGQVLIQRGTKTYTLTGVEVR